MEGLVMTGNESLKVLLDSIRKMPLLGHTSFTAVLEDTRYGSKDAFIVVAVSFDAG